MNEISSLGNTLDTTRKELRKYTEMTVYVSVIIVYL